ncbi:MAG: ABC transporter ATP-binding protein [Chloroflexi bacterium]|nr:MAG: ABC transporter ATP-binding protein [Chloroflexota bacterium]
MRLKVREVTFSYGSFPALRGVCFEVGEGEVVSLVGPNGSGKTTLLKCINKILTPKKGAIFLNGGDIRGFDLRRLARFIGYVPQSTSHPFPLTVFDVILLGRKPYINWRVEERDKDIVAEVILSFGLEELASREFNELSGGEKQKVLLARALAQAPEVLLLDEPTSNLDLKHQLEVMELIRSLARERGIVVIMAIHDLNLASRFSDRLIFLREGKVFAAGSPEEVLTPENIKEVYGVRALVMNHTELKKPYLVPLAST